MQIQSRLNQLNKKLSDKIKTGDKYADYRNMVKIELGWRYGDENDNRQVVTLQEWDQYKTHCLKHAKDQEKEHRDLDELENKIRNAGGFMEIGFILKE
jgi:hypothetical protein